MPLNRYKAPLDKLPRQVQLRRQVGTWDAKKLVRTVRELGLDARAMERLGNAEAIRDAVAEALYEKELDDGVRR